MNLEGNMSEKEDEKHIKIKQLSGKHGKVGNKCGPKHQDLKSEVRKHPPPPTREHFPLPEHFVER
jgi:hypothetical protein